MRIVGPIAALFVVLSGVASATGDPGDEALSIRSGGLASFLEHPKDAGLVAALGMVDARLADLPDEADGVREDDIAVVRLIWELVRRPMSAQLFEGASDGSAPPFTGRLVFEYDDGAAASSAAERLIDTLAESDLPLDIRDAAGVIDTPLGEVRVGSVGRRVVLALGDLPRGVADPAFAALPGGAAPSFGLRFSAASFRPIAEMALAEARTDADRARGERVLRTLGLYGASAIEVDSAWGFDGDDAVGVIRVPGHRTKREVAFIPAGEALGRVALGMIPADATVASGCVFDLASLLEVADAFEPGAARRFLDEVGEAVGLHPWDDLLGHIGDRWLFYQSDRTGGGGILSSVALVELADAEAFVAGHATLVERINGLVASEADGYVRIHERAMGDVAVFTVETPGLPLPVELSWAVVDGWAVVATSPANLAVAARRARAGGPSIADNPFLGRLAGGDPASLVGFNYMDADRAARRGYGAVMLLGSAMRNGVRAPGGDREPAEVVPPFDELVAGVRPTVSIARWEGDDLVARYRWDGSALVGVSAAMGQYGGLYAAQMMGVMATTLMPAVDKARDNALQLTSATHARAIAQAMIGAAAANDDRFDGTLEDLVAADLLNPLLLESPYGPAWDGGPDYVIKPDVRDTFDATEVVVVDRAMLLEGLDVVNVAYADGHVVAVTRWELREAAELEVNAWLRELVE